MNKICRKLNSIYTKYLLHKYQFVYMYGDVPIKHLLVPKKNADTLVVVFSGMNPLKASYNYIDLLNGMNCHRLYVLDDIGDNVLGCYYLGTQGDNQVELAVKALVSKVLHDLAAKKIIFCGSSKGGYAALNIGLDFPNATIIVGAPQYKLGYYLSHRKSPALLNIVLGENVSPSSLEILDSRIQEKIKRCGCLYGGVVYLHYSYREHTYDEHIRHLISDLDEFGINFYEDHASYTEHDDVSAYFPSYLKNTLKLILR